MSPSRPFHLATRYYQPYCASSHSWVKYVKLSSTEVVREHHVLTMKELLIRAEPIATLIESPIPRTRPTQVIVKVMVAGGNPKDWKYPERFGTDSSQGEDIAGIVMKQEMMSAGLR
jgi:hypothetical protein